MKRVRTVLAYAKKPVAAVMMRPILRALEADPGFRILGCSRHLGEPDSGGLFASAGLGRMHLEPKWLARLRRYDVYLSADFGVVAPRSRLKVHVFHGVSFRNHAVHSSALRYDLLLLPGPYMRRRFEAMGILTAENAHRFAVVGMPKLDALVRGEHARVPVLESLRLDPALPTLLFAPTWSRKTSSLERWGDALIAALGELSRADYNVIVKLHDNSLDVRKASRDWRAAFRPHERGRLRFAAAADVVPLMAASDALVSDASSVANEYCLLDRPLLFLEVPRMLEKLKAKADLDTWGRRAGRLVEHPAQLAAAVAEELAAPQRLASVRKALAADLFFEPGRATEHAVSALKSALEALG